MFDITKIKPAKTAKGRFSVKVGSTRYWLEWDKGEQVYNVYADGSDTPLPYLRFVSRSKARVTRDVIEYFTN